MGVLLRYFYCGLFGLVSITLQVQGQSSFACLDAKEIIEFVQSEHLRFRADPSVKEKKFVQEVLQKIPEVLRDYGYWMLASEVERKSKFSTDSDSFSVEEVCKNLKTPMERLAFVKSYVQSLDPFSDFYFEEEFKNKTSVVSGHFVGVGIGTNTQDDGSLLITEVLSAGPADEVLFEGDKILKIDGHDVSKLSSKQVAQRIRGPLHSLVEFEGTRKEGKSFHVRVRRGHVIQQSVTHEWMDEHFLKIKIHRFFAQTALQISKLIEENRSRIKGIVLDLRDNPGGLLQSARDIVSLFIPSGVVVYLRGLYSDELWSVQMKPDEKTPLVIYVNEKTASASEIVAGALQDYGRAVVVGQKTFGKSCVQNVYQTDEVLETKYKGGLKLTTLWYYLPSGRSVRHLNPDIVLPSSDENIAHLEMPYEWEKNIQVYPIKRTQNSLKKIEKWKASDLAQADDEIGSKILKKLLATIHSF